MRRDTSKDKKSARGCVYVQEKSGMAEISTTLYNTAHCDEHSMPKVVRIFNGSILLILTPIMHFRLLLSGDYVVIYNLDWLGTR